MARATLVKGIQVVVSEEQAANIWDTVPENCCWDLRLLPGKQAEQRLIIGVQASHVELYAENEDEAVEVEIRGQGPDTSEIEKYVKEQGWTWNPAPYLIVGDY